MTISEFFDKLNRSPETIAFAETMETIEANYTFTETSFENGSTINEAGVNSGSCKLFAFAQLNDLDVDQTLACFGDYYRKDVLENPNATDHANIRSFIEFGWEGIKFKGQALAPK